MMLFNPCNSISKADLVLLAVCYFYLPYTIWGQFILEYLLSIACMPGDLPLLLPILPTWMTNTFTTGQYLMRTDN